MKKVKCTLTQRRWEILQESLRYYGEAMQENGFGNETKTVNSVRKKLDAGSWKMSKDDLETIKLALEA